MENSEIRVITPDQIEKAMDGISLIGANPLQVLVGTFRQEQPGLHRFLLEAEDELSDEERKTLVSAGLVGWQIVHSVLGPVAEAGIDFINSRLEMNFTLIDEKVNGEDRAGEPLRKILSYYNNQEELMAFLVSLIVERPGGGAGVIRNEALMPMIVLLKTLIDCIVLGDNGGAVQPE